MKILLYYWLATSVLFLWRVRRYSACDSFALDCLACFMWGWIVIPFLMLEGLGI